ncbi:hypothetical protein [Amedibacillus dolichus]|uniref:hypothetical protein n=1 Tax=Amedibacillus dolichus TaxID=31971 RepID=UPI0024200AC7|nr:hypothetical protein [Amedibacillus dolichus]
MISKDGTISDVDLKAGLNIIYGESNTGKSLIVDCLDYLYGAKEHRFDQKLNLKQIGLTIDVDGKSVSLTREIDSNFIEVSSTCPYIESGKYNANNGKKPIYIVWLRLMKIEDDVRIIKTLAGKTQKLTFRTFCHLFLIDEDRAINKNSVLSTGTGKSKRVDTNVLSALLYLATSNNYLPDKEGKDAPTRKARKEAVQKFVDRSMAKLADQKLSELMNLSKETPVELQKSIDSIINEIGNAEGILEESLKRSMELSTQITEIDAEINESRVLFNRNKTLATQYASDIKRLTFIAEGDIYGEDIPKLDRCPFCNGELPKEQNDSCIDAAIAEVAKIEVHVKDLESVQRSLESELKQLNTDKQALVEERRQVEMSIRREVQPQISMLKDKLASYTTALNQYKAQEMIEKFSNVLLSELKVTEEEESDELQINIPQLFNQTFTAMIETELQKLLKECNYKNYTGSRFDKSDYDVVVNGHLKKSQGKGFRAFLNTLVAIAIQNCLFTYGLHIPRIFVVDSPILSLKEKEDHIGEEHMSETMKVGLFNYMVNHQPDKQIIIIENEIPNIDYGNANLIQFTKDENIGRYGLIIGYRE